MTWGERERHTQSFYADCFYIVSSQPNQRAAPVTNKTCLASPRSEFQISRSAAKTQLTAFFQIPKIFSASGHDVIHVPGRISYLSFLLWHLWLSHPPRTRVNTCTQLTHALTNPCTKRKVLSLTKPKGVKYKTKNDNIKKTLGKYNTNLRYMAYVIDFRDNLRTPYTTGIWSV